VETTRIGPYRLEERLGAGGMGVVYRAYDERLDRWVAVKLLHADRGGAIDRERLRREARACARLSHPAIVRVFDLIQEGQTEAIVMELVEGRTLAEHLRAGSLDPSQALSIARDVAEALAEAHVHGVIHRDLKTENVLVTPVARAKILDFGVAKQPERGETSLTIEGMVVGTARAMSPEQARGQEADTRSDLFSLGVLLYEIFTGTSPFVARTALATLDRVCTHLQPPALSRAPSLARELSDLIDCLLEKDPERRPASARQVALILEGLTPGLAAPAPEGFDEATAAIPAEPAPPALQAEAERRHVTVLSCDLVRETGEALDPAELPDTMDRLEGVVAAAVQRFGGQVERDDRGGWQAFFGYPRAHEDDARRAVSAALELASTIAGAGLGGRIGLSTGPLTVVRGSDLSGRERVLGDASGIAAALRRLAAPGSVLVGAETGRRVEGFFALEELSPLTPSGGSGPLRVYRARAGSGVHNRVHAAGQLTPLVGRDQEMGILLERWDLAQEGRGQVILLAGEAGLGKSRLVWELRQRIGSGATWLEGHASPFYRDSALYPILQWLDQWIGVERHDAPEIRLARLEKRLATYRIPPEETLPLIASLLHLPTGDRWPLPLMTPDVQRRRALETLLELIMATAERQPLLVFVEDLHWVDPSSLELLGRLIEQAGALPLLLLVTFRPEVRIPWEERSHVTRLTLGPLSRKQIAGMVEQIIAGRALNSKAHEQIALRTDGVPLFVEELTKMLLELEGTPDDQRPREIPDSLEGWLGARLDRLETARQVAQLAAVLGRDFSQEILHAVAPWDAESLQRELDRLVAAEILYRQGFPPRCRYRFKHALLQDAAYASLMPTERQRHHRRVAEFLRDRFPEVAESQSELLAHHLTEAGLLDQAIPAWQQAGAVALRASAGAEASSHIQRALALLAQTPESPGRDLREIALQVALGVAEATRRSYAVPEVRTAYLRAWDLCSRTGSDSHAFPVLRGLFVHYMITGQMRSALHVSEQTLELARHDGSPHLLLISHQALGFTRLWLGDFAAAREHLATALSFGEVESPEANLLLPGAGNPLLEARCNLATLLWFQGEPDTALAMLAEAVAQAQSRSLPYTYGFLLLFLSEMHLWRGEGEAAGRHAREIERLADEHGFHHYRLMSMFLRGCATTMEEGGTAGTRDEMRASIAERLAFGGRVNVPSHAALLAHRLLQDGPLDECAAALDTGFRISEEGEQHYATAELLRLRGELLLRQGAPPGEAEDVLREALGLARRQGTKSLELRAATSLARLWAGQGRRDEARDLLAGIYGWFTEGFDTGDLCAARDLLTAL